MKKKFFYKLFVFTLFISVMVVGVNINLLYGVNENLTNIALCNIEILAQNEGENLDDCPGGFCYYGGWSSCGACCPERKEPFCTSFGCGCISY